MQCYVFRFKESSSDIILQKFNKHKCTFKLQFGKLNVRLRDLNFRKVMPDNISLNRNMQQCMTNIKLLTWTVILHLYPI